MVAPHTAWRRRCTGLSLHAAASSALSLCVSLCPSSRPSHSVHSLRPYPTHVCPPSVLPCFATLATDAVVVGRRWGTRGGGTEERGRTEQDELERGGKHAHAYVSVKLHGERGGWRRRGERERERGREAELTRHGNGKWDATEYRWTLTGMRVRITGCHPYSAGLAAVSGQCHRYISIITFAIATSRLHSNAHAALPHCAAVVRLHISSRRPICIRYASLSRSPSLPATLQLLPIEHGSPSFRPFIQPPALRLALFSLAAHRPPCTECVRISCAAPLAWIPVIREERRGERVYVEARFRNAGQSHHRSLPKLS